MLFNSLDFAVFLPLVFGLYWLTRGNLKQQNALIVMASYIFYGWWDYRFLALIFLSAVVDYTVGLQLERAQHPRSRKALLYASIVFNLGVLGFFKYYNFFLENFVAAFSVFGMEIQPGSLNILLPVGISFYTFQTLSYTIDIYRNKLEPTRDFVTFCAFVSFFPSWWQARLSVPPICCPSFIILGRLTQRTRWMDCVKYCGDCLKKS